MDMKKKIVRKIVIITMLALFVLCMFVAIITNYSNIKAASENVQNVSAVYERMLGGMSLEEIKDKFSNSNEEITRVVVFDSSGNVVVDSLSRENEIDNINGSKEFSEAMSGDSRTKIEIIQERREVWLNYTVKIRNGDFDGGFFLIRVGYLYSDDVFRFYFSVPIIIVALILITILATVFTNKLIKTAVTPFEMIEESLEEINRGEYHQVTLNTKYEDINRVVKGINDVSSKIFNSLNYLKYEQRKNEFLLENIDQGVLAISKKGKIILANESIKEITITSENEHINDFVLPTTNNPICLSVVPHLIGTGAKLFLTQLLLGRPYGDDYEWMKGALIFQADFSGEESSISLSPPFQSVASYVNDTYVTKKCIPYVVSNIKDGKELYHCAVSFYTTVPSGTYHYIEIEWGLDVEAANKSVTSGPTAGYTYDMQRVCFSKKNKGELVSLATSSTSTSGSPNQYRINSGPNNIFSSSFTGGLYKIDATAKSELPVNIAGKNYVISLFTLTNLPIFSHTEPFSKAVSHGIQLPSSARIFIDAGAYLWGKDIYMIFVGTGIIFSRTLEEGSFGYLDTTSVLGTITQFGYLDYSEDEGTLYIVGQDTTNRVKVAKIVLNTLYDYANDGAWLPMISADGVPAWIKAIGENDDQNITDPVDMKITVSRVSQYANIIFNGDALYTTGTYTRKVSESGTFTVGLRTVKADNVGGNIALKLNGTVILNMSFNGTAGLEKTVTLKTSDYISGGITLRA